MINRDSSQRAQSVRRTLARGIGLGSLVMLIVSAVEGATNFGIHRALGVNPGAFSHLSYRLTVTHLIFEAVFFVAVLVIGLTGLRWGWKGKRVLFGLLVIAGGALLGSFWGYIPTSTEFGERLNLVCTSTLPTGVFWVIAGAGLGWSGALPGFIRDRAVLYCLVTALLVLGFLVVLLGIALSVRMLFFGL